MTRPLVEVSLYLVVPPSDISRTKPLIHLTLIQIGRCLTESLNGSDGIERNDKLLLMPEESRRWAVSLFSTEAHPDEHTNQETATYPPPHQEVTKLTFTCPTNLKAVLYHYAALPPQAFGRAVDAMTFIPHAGSIHDRGSGIQETMREQDCVIEARQPRGPCAPATLKAASPINHIRKPAPSVMLIHSMADQVIPYQQSEAIAQALQRKGGAGDTAAFAGGKSQLCRQRSGRHTSS